MLNQNVKILLIFGVMTGIIALPCLTFIIDIQNQLNQKNEQIEMLENQIGVLENDLGTIKKGEWNVVDSFGGSSGIATDYFYVAGTELRITWVAYNGFNESIYFEIDVFKEGQNEPFTSYSDLNDQGSVLLQSIEKGNYYLNISEENVDQWSITVETWIAPN